MLMRQNEAFGEEINVYKYMSLAMLVTDWMLLVFG